MAEKELDQQFVESIVKQLVSKPDKVETARKIDELGVLIELYVDKEDMGAIIGKEGKTAKAIRTLLRVMGAKNDARINLKIVEPDRDDSTEEKKHLTKEAEKEESDEAPLADLDL